jgi:hypothetical protein
LPALALRDLPTGAVATCPLRPAHHRRLAARHERDHQGLLRQYRPKGGGLRELTRAECDSVALQLDSQSSKTLEWKGPGPVLNSGLAGSAARSHQARIVGDDV